MLNSAAWPLGSAAPRVRRSCVNLRKVILYSPALTCRRTTTVARVAEADSVEMEAITPEMQQQFDRIAATLVEKLASIPIEAQKDFWLQEEALSAESTSEQPGSSSSQPQIPQGAFDLLKRKRGQIPTENLPKVCILGRPNVGKSALFNRMAGSPIAVVYDQPGVTRDRLYTRTKWNDKEYVIIDTGGLVSDATRLPLRSGGEPLKSVDKKDLPEAIERQALAGVQEADAIVLVVDGKQGLQAGDREIVQWLRENHPSKPVVLAVNKCENQNKADLQAAEFWELGLTPIALSAISGSGTGEFLDSLTQVLPPPRQLTETEEDEPLAVAIVGRPNVGKSSLVNAIAGEERTLVCDLSGTTRDAVDTTVTLDDGTKIKIVDTAGIRRRTKVEGSKEGPESLAVDAAIRAARRAQVVVLVVDGSEGVTQQDFRLAELVADQGRAVVVVVNKWDLVDKDEWTMEKMAEDVTAQLRHVSWARVVCTTASKGRRVQDVVDAVRAAGAEHTRRIPTATLNMVVKEATQWKKPPSMKGGQRQGRIYYATQVSVSPPTFIFFCNSPSLIPDEYRRYVERSLREQVGFHGTPLRLVFRGKDTGAERNLNVVQVKGPGAKAAAKTGGRHRDSSNYRPSGKMSFKR